MAREEAAQTPVAEALDPRAVMSAETCGGNKSGVMKRNIEAGSANAHANAIAKMMSAAVRPPTPSSSKRSGDSHSPLRR